MNVRYTALTILIGVTLGLVDGASAATKNTDKAAVALPKTLQIGDVTWATDELFRTPAVTPTTDCPVAGLQSIYYEGLPFRGKPTRVFAYIGVPKPTTQPTSTQAPSTQPARYPAVVLVHGGGGTAYERWVRYWTARGYVAIAMDNCGYRPDRQPVRDGACSQNDTFTQLDLPTTDQWPYQAVAAVIRAHSLLRARPDVEPDRIGIVGISWGGYLTCLTLGIDHRFAFGVPIYGCGFIGADSMWGDVLTQTLTPAQSQQWHRMWDPSLYLKHITTPTLWLTGVNDPAYPLGSWEQSIDAIPATSPRPIRSLQLEMVHTHSKISENVEVVFRFAESLTYKLSQSSTIQPCDSVARKNICLPTVQRIDRMNDSLWVAAAGPYLGPNTTLAYTTDSGPWKARKWKTQTAKPNSSSHMDSNTTAGPYYSTGHDYLTPLPKDATAAFFIFQDTRDPAATVTSNVLILTPPTTQPTTQPASQTTSPK